MNGEAGLGAGSSSSRKDEAEEASEAAVAGSRAPASRSRGGEVTNDGDGRRRVASDGVALCREELGRQGRRAGAPTSGAEAEARGDE